MTVLPGNDKIQKADIRVRVTDVNTSVTKVIKDVLSLTVGFAKNDIMSWTLTLDNWNRQYSKHNTTSEYYGYTDVLEKNIWEIAVKTKGAITLSADPTPVESVTEEEETWTYLTANDRSYTTSATDGSTVSITGADYSWKLLKNNQSKVTLRSTGLSLVTAKAIAASIMTDYGVTYDMNGVTDYTVPWLHFQGEIPLDVIRKLMGTRWAIYRFIGNVFTAWEPTYKVPPTEPDFYIEDIITIESISMNESRQSMVTSAVVRRTSEIGSIAFEAQGSETTAQTVEVNSSSFPDGAVDLMYAEAVSGGTIHEVWYFSGPGLTGMMGGNHGCPTPSAKSMTFYFQPTIGETTFLYHIIVRGRKPILNEDPALFANFCVKYRNSTLETEVGTEYPASETVTEDLIPDVTTAIWYVQQYLKEAARKIETYNIVCGLHIKIYPGHTIAVKEWSMFLDKTLSSARFFVESVSHDFTAGTTTLTVSKYRPDDTYVQVTPWPPTT